MRYLTAEEIMLIHSVVIDETGGSHGVRTTGAIQSAADAPCQAFGGTELYPSVFEKAAVYARQLIMNHPFIDGNKRTGITAASIFIEDNGYRLTAKQGELETLALKIVNEKLDIQKISEWFKKHTKKPK